MPRSSGVYSLPAGYLATTGEKVLASQHNGPLEDLAASMTNSLPRDGQAPMLGNLPMGGNKITGLATGTANNDAATVAQVASAIPVGVMVPYAGTTAPSGWLLCYGQAVSRSTYAALFSVINTIHGAGDGATTFNLPDARDAAIVGKGNMGGTAKGLLSKFASVTLGAIFGVQEHALTPAQNAPHKHNSGTLTAANHVHPFGTEAIGNVGAGTRRFVTGTASNPLNTLGSGDLSVSGETASSGDGEAHPNVQPSLVMNFIIKAL